MSDHTHVCKNCEALKAERDEARAEVLELVRMTDEAESAVGRLTQEVTRLKQHVGAKVIDHAVSCLWPQERCTCVRRNDNESVRQETT